MNFAIPGVALLFLVGCYLLVNGIRLTIKKEGAGIAVSLWGVGMLASSTFAFYSITGYPSLPH